MREFRAFLTVHKAAIVIVLSVLLAISFTVGIWLRGYHEKSQTTTQPASPGSVNTSTQPTQPSQPSNTNTRPTPRPAP